MKRRKRRPFFPLSDQLGIPGTPNRFLLGLINDKWAIRLLKDKDVIDSYVFKEEDMSASGFPNQNLIVGWVYIYKFLIIFSLSILFCKILCFKSVRFSR